MDQRGRCTSDVPDAYQSFSRDCRVVEGPSLIANPRTTETGQQGEYVGLLGNECLVKLALPPI